MPNGQQQEHSFAEQQQILDELPKGGGAAKALRRAAEIAVTDPGNILQQIVDARGLLPSQRRMFQEALNRQIGRQVSQAGQAFGRRAAAQGLTGGLADVGLANVFGQGLQAQAAGQGRLAGLGLQQFQRALAALQRRNERMREEEERRRAGQFKLISDIVGLGTSIFGGGDDEEEFI